MLIIGGELMFFKKFIRNVVKFLLKYVYNWGIYI